MISALGVSTARIFEQRKISMTIIQLWIEAVLLLLVIMIVQSFLTLFIGLDPGARDWPDMGTLAAASSFLKGVQLFHNHQSNLDPTQCSKIQNQIWKCAV